VSGFSSMFSPLLKLFPRTEFQALVKRTHAERQARGFTCWGQFVAMLFCQLGRAHSLREICGGLRSSEGKLKHLGITAPARSTLAYANEHRPWQLYRAVFDELLARCQPLARGRRKFRFKNKLVSLDSTVIDLCAPLFDWAKFRRTKGAVKLHCLFIPMPGAPDGVEVSPIDGTIHVNTVGVAAGMKDPAKGGMYRLTKGDFKMGRLPAPFSQDWGALDGLVFTAAGTRLDTQILPPNFLTVLPHGSSSPMVLNIEGLDRPLAGPADIAVFKRPDGSSLLLIPELSALTPNNNDNPVDVVRLPPGF
jgi:Domain of unknown function (DUF4372)